MNLNRVTQSPESMSRHAPRASICRSSSITSALLAFHTPMTSATDHATWILFLSRLYPLLFAFPFREELNGLHATHAFKWSAQRWGRRMPRLANLVHGPRGDSSTWHSSEFR